MYEATVTKIFCAAHAIRLENGSPEPLHGHNWEIRVTVSAAKLNSIEAVMDFHELERLVDAVVAPAENQNLNDVGPFANNRSSPTAERVAWWIGTEVAKKLPEGVSLAAVVVGEGPGCHGAFRPR